MDRTKAEALRIVYDMYKTEDMIIPSVIQLGVAAGKVIQALEEQLKGEN